jgi:hypothetical protein
MDTSDPVSAPAEPGRAEHVARAWLNRCVGDPCEDHYASLASALRRESPHPPTKE